MWRGLSPTQQKIITTKYNGGIRFKDINLQAIQAIVDLLIEEIVVITGWKIQADAARDILLEYLVVRLKGEYEDLNMDDVRLAFISHSSKVKDYYGKPFSVQLFDDVMGFYLRDRNEVIEIEKDCVAKIEPNKIVDIEEIKSQSRINLIEEYSNYKKGLFDPLNSITASITYDTLFSDGFVEKGFHNRYLTNGLFMLRKEIKQQIELSKCKEYKDKDCIKSEVEVRDLKYELSILERVLKKSKQHALKLAFDYYIKQGVEDLKVMYEKV